MALLQRKHLEILTMLKEHGELTARQIAEPMGNAPGWASDTTARLVRLGYVTSRRGESADIKYYYTITAEGLSKIAERG